MQGWNTVGFRGGHAIRPQLNLLTKNARTQLETTILFSLVGTGREFRSVPVGPLLFADDTVYLPYRGRSSNHAWLLLGMLWRRQTVRERRTAFPPFNEPLRIFQPPLPRRFTHHPCLLPLPFALPVIIRAQVLPERQRRRPRGRRGGEFYAFLGDFSREEPRRWQDNEQEG